MTSIKFDLSKFTESVSSLRPSNFQYRSLIVSQFVWEDGIAEVDSLDLVVKDRGPLQADGYGVVLYIKDHGSGIDWVIEEPSEGRKVHLAYCRTLERMEREGNFERYHLKRSPERDFLISGTTRVGGEVEAEVPLSVCMNCLAQLNYKNFRNMSLIRGHKKQATRDFDFAEFFENYSSFFPKLPMRDENSPVGYTSDWKEVSKRARIDAKNRCASCGVDLTAAPDLLHTHHVNRVKSDNSPTNLKVLCASCHRREENHEHLHLTRRDHQVIEDNRKIQGIPVGSNMDLIKWSDMGWEQPIKIFQRKYGGKVERYFDLADSDNSVICNITIAFIDRKVGLIDRYSQADADRARTVGWKLFTHDEAMAA